MHDQQGEGTILTMPSTISIIIPLYNHSEKLLDCLQSIKNQTIFSPPARGGDTEEVGVEIIIVNDGSTDIAHDVLVKNVNGQMSMVKCFYQSNAGAPTARNNGFKASNGDYILFCDADVVMKPNMLQKMVTVLDENPNVSYVYSSFKFGWKKFTLWEFDADKLKQMPYIHSTSLIRRSALESIAQYNGEPWDPLIKRLQDWDLWLSLLEKGYVGKWIPEILFTVKTGGTMSSWLPSWLTKWGFFGTSKSYQQAVKIVKNKHRL